MTISKYIVLFPPKKKKKVLVRGSEDLKQAKGCTFSHILHYECYCSKQKCNRSKSSLRISWEKHPSGPVNSCVSTSTSRVHQQQIAGNKEEPPGNDHSRLVFSPLNPCSSPLPVSDTGAWWDGLLAYQFLSFMLWTGNALIPTHGRDFLSTRLEFLTRMWPVRCQEECQRGSEHQAFGSPGPQDTVLT